MALRRCMVSLPGNPLGIATQFATVAIIQAKSRKQMGFTQFAMVRSSNATNWLLWLCDGLLPYDKLWVSSHDEFRKRFKKLVSEIGLQSWNVVPGCLRPGGTTWFFSGGVEPGRLLFWGRWASEKSLRHYIQESISHQILLSAPVETRNKLTALLDTGHDLLEVPTAHWTSFAARPGSHKYLPSHLTCQSQGASKWKELYPAYTDGR